MRTKGLSRVAEVGISVAILAATAPILAAAALMVAASSPGPVLFRHERAGRFGRPFTMLKFRTMQVASGGPEVTAGGDARVTRVGRLLRKTKVDELPELWNVVRGDMSLVGPRPEALRYASLDRPEWREVLSVRPGITDPTTLRLRNEEALLAASGSEYEVFYRRYLLPYKLLGYRQYITDQTWMRDVAVLALTLLAVLFPRLQCPPTRREIVSTVRHARAGHRTPLRAPVEDV